MNKPLATSLLALLPLMGCATVSPPPPTMALGGASQTPTGSTSATVYGGASAGVFIRESLGGGLRLQHRLSPSVAIGAEGAAGAQLDPHADEPEIPRTLYTGRAHMQINPSGNENFAITAGAGGGATNNSLSYLTVDGGARVSGRYSRRRVEPYLAGMVGISAPLNTPAGAVLDGGNDRRFLTTFYVGANVGITYHADERFAVTADLPAFLGFSASNNALLFVPTLSLRYAFGGETPAR